VAHHGICEEATMDEHERSTPEPGEVRGKSRTAILILVAVLSMTCFVVETQAAPVISYSFSDVEYPGADFTGAFGLNDRGQVVGGALLPLPPAERREFGFVFSSGQFTQFAVPNASNTSLLGINNSGTIVGISFTPAQGLLLQDGSFTPIIFPGAIATSTRGINDRGDISGDYGFVSTGPSHSHGFILRDGQFMLIPDPPGLVNPNIYGINNRGNIVGSGSDTSGASRGFMFDGTTFTSIDVPGASQTQPLGINDRGQIVGLAQFKGTHESGFLLDHQAFTLIDVPGAFNTIIWGSIIEARSWVNTSILAALTADVRASMASSLLLSPRLHRFFFSSPV
jgi:uncharacterized membrane protein